MNPRTALVALLLIVSVPATRGWASAADQLYSDSEKEASLRQRLQHLRLENLHVTVLGRMATLGGTAESLGDKNEATKLAKACPGVDEVLDELAIVSVGDDELQRNVEAALDKDPHYTVYDFVTAEARDGEVVLTGQATLPSDAEAIAESVSKARGARAIVNDVRILPWSPADERLREDVATAVYKELVASRDVDAPVHVVVDNGRVTLHGTLEDDRKIEDVEAATRGVPGVLSVENLLTLRDAEAAS